MRFLLLPGSGCLIRFSDRMESPEINRMTSRSSASLEMSESKVHSSFKNSRPAALVDRDRPENERFQSSLNFRELIAQRRSQTATDQEMSDSKVHLTSANFSRFYTESRMAQSVAGSTLRSPEANSRALEFCAVELRGLSPAPATPSLE